MQFPHSFDDRRRSLLVAGISLPSAGLFTTIPFAASATGVSVQAMLAKPWQANLDPADYLVSEKLDGVRALWDGKVLRFRSGRPIAAPAWFVKDLPAMFLDGELWGGRHRFDQVSGTVRASEPLDGQWHAVRYMLFDLPQSSDPFAQRAAHMQELVAQSRLPWLQAVEQGDVADSAALHQRLRGVVAAGGEGLVLHRRDALWAPGRSDALRKLKPLPDEEGLVLAHLPGTGKYQGKMGALLLQTPEGQRFALGSGFADAMRAQPPAVGSLVTYRYRDRTATGLPKFASFLRVRDAE
ncbi:DNA ligase [Rhodoferax sp. GW822-FHT02A01]|uniref:DNA ligase n=1 Tax=Rhodoferax sp. GW822-FHT02A01 TaxID=3141537 RepID=UPI00315CF474